MSELVSWGLSNILALNDLPITLILRYIGLICFMHYNNSHKTYAVTLFGPCEDVLEEPLLVLYTAGFWYSIF